jgi:GAF domain-containing protein
MTMAQDDPTKPTYVERVRANTRAYIEEILGENARLRSSAERIDAEHEALRQKLDDLRAELLRRDRDAAKLIDLVGRAEAETRRHEERFVEVELQNSNLAALYAASYQLHASLRKSEVLATMQEIVVNLIGSEELGVLGLGAGGLEPLVSMGVEAETLAGLRTDVGLLAAALASGQPCAVGAEGRGDDGVTACIPLVVAGRTIALVVIFSLLPQKPVLQAIDMELFGLLGHHAATALHCAELHEQRERDEQRAGRPC